MKGAYAMGQDHYRKREAVRDAAPDLLAALERLAYAATACSCLDAEVAIARAAIAKARGQS